MGRAESAKQAGKPIKEKNGAKEKQEPKHKLRAVASNRIFDPA